MTIEEEALEYMLNDNKEKFDSIISKADLSKKVQDNKTLLDYIKNNDDLYYLNSLFKHFGYKDSNDKDYNMSRNSFTVRFLNTNFLKKSIDSLIDFRTSSKDKVYLENIINVLSSYKNIAEMLPGEYFTKYVYYILDTDSLDKKSLDSIDNMMRLTTTESVERLKNKIKDYRENKNYDELVSIINKNYISQNPKERIKDIENIKSNDRVIINGKYIPKVYSSEYMKLQREVNPPELDVVMSKLDKKSDEYKDLEERREYIEKHPNLSDAGRKDVIKSSIYFKNEKKNISKNIDEMIDELEKSNGRVDEYVDLVNRKRYIDSHRNLTNEQINNIISESLYSKKNKVEPKKADAKKEFKVESNKNDKKIEKSTRTNHIENIEAANKALEKAKNSKLDHLDNGYLKNENDKKIDLINNKNNNKTNPEEDVLPPPTKDIPAKKIEPVKLVKTQSERVKEAKNNANSQYESLNDSKSNLKVHSLYFAQRRYIRELEKEIEDKKRLNKDTSHDDLNLEIATLKNKIIYDLANWGDITPELQSEIDKKNKDIMKKTNYRVDLTDYEVEMLMTMSHMGILPEKSKSKNTK